MTTPKWPRDTQQARNAFYGDPANGEIAEQLVPVVPPFAMYYTDGNVTKRIKSISFHKKAAPYLLAALNEIWDFYGRDQKRIDAAGVSKYAGAYNHRKVRGSSTKWSNHAYGAAIDLNADQNGLNAGHGNMPAPVIDAFTRQGAMWGGWYKGRTDPMHFEFVDNGGRKANSPVPVYSPKLPTFLVPNKHPPVEDEYEGGPAPVTPAGKPITPTPPTPPEKSPLNVQPQSSVYDAQLQALQVQLLSLRYYEVGEADGFWGGKTRGAVTAFMNDRGKPTDGMVTPEVYSEISAAVAEKWTRPIAPSRANATAADIAPKVPVINQTWYQKLWAWVLGIPAAFMAGFKNLFGDDADPSSYISVAKSWFSSVPLEVWLLGVAGLAIAIFISADRAQKATVEAYQRGEIN